MIEPWVILMNKIEGTSLEVITEVQVHKRGGRKCDKMKLYTHVVPMSISWFCSVP